MLLCQEFGGFPKEGGLRDQDAYDIKLWIIMLSARGEALNKKAKAKGKK